MRKNYPRGSSMNINSYSGDGGHSRIWIQSNIHNKCNRSKNYKKHTHARRELSPYQDHAKSLARALATTSGESSPTDAGKIQNSEL